MITKLVGALVVSACVIALTDSFNMSTAVAAESGDPGATLKKTLTVSAGGPYIAEAGLPITLRGTYAAADEADDTNRLMVIGRALQAYLAAKGTYPPAALLNAHGQATLSWRVLILPYLGQKDLYDRFDLTKPWDHPDNLRLLKDIPDVYLRSGAVADTTESDPYRARTERHFETGFAGVRGTESLFENNSKKLDGGLSPREINGGTTYHIAVGPVGKHVHLPWSAPGDIVVAEEPKLGARDGFSGAGDAFTPLLFLDGTVRLIPDDIKASVMISWANLKGPFCSCAQPNQLDAGLQAFWDLDGKGKYETMGSNVTYVPSKPGTYQVGLRVIDRFGGQYDKTAVVEAH